VNIPLASSAADSSGALLALFVLLLAAKLGDELFRRIGQPVVIGEILAGVVVGPSVLGLVEFDDVISLFAELGVIFLLFWVGLESRLGDLRNVGRPAAIVGTLGVVIPVASGIAAAFAFGASTATAVFIGAALAATSVGITSAILVELGLQASRAGRTILGAAVIDDILALIVLAVATGVASEGGVSVGEILLLIGLSVGFLAFFGLGGQRLLAARPAVLEAPRFADSALLPAVLLCLALAVLAAEIGLAAVIGAFLAGMIVAETKDHNSIETEIKPLYTFFAPFFFASIGVQLELGALAGLDTLLLVVGITLLAIVTKYVAAWLGAKSLGPRGRAIVGAGMVPRGEVGVIVAGLGYGSGAIDAEIFGVVVAMAVLTTLVAPYMLRRAAREPAISAS
jgi:Kef-type K+ transport system membrane component KefB